MATMTSSVFRITEHVLPAQHIREYPRATANEQDEVLQLAIKQYTPLNNTRPKTGDVTIIGGHANGFPKELYEPLWCELLQRLNRNGIRIRGVWIMDSSHQGASGVMNEYKMGDDPSWLDGARDNLHMINTFRDQMPRPIVGVGHSMGAAQLANLALLHPRLLTTLVLMEPVIQLESPVSSNSTGAAGASTFRRDIWPSRAAAEKTFRNHQFYQRWDPRVLDLWIKYGFRELPTAIYSSSPQGEKPVTLTTTKHQEVFSFARPNFPSTYAGSSVRAVNRITHPDLDPENIEYPTYRYEPASTFLKLPFIRPSVLYIFGEDSIISSPEGRKAKTTTTGTGVGGSGGAQEGRVKDIHLAKIGHLVAMEALGACADAASAWLSTELERWRQEADAFQQEWNKKSLVEKSTTSAEWNSIMTPKVWKEIFPKEKTKKATGSKL